MDEAYFYSIEKQRTTTLKIKRSIFKCSLERVDSIDAAKGFISRISRENKMATHNCWAYIIGEKGETFHCSDAGEPSGTAGKPMLNALKRHQMTDISAVVTRHFGGVKLGVRGLIEAYFESVETTIKAGKRIKIIQGVSFRVEVGYGFNDTLLNQIKPYLTRVKDTTYADTIVHIIEIEMKDYDSVAQLLSGYQSQKKLNFSLVLPPAG